ncbi:MAG TPA: glucose-6-phosphate dehydrogenase [Candidatus Paceibacterota bacterium]|jgi:glucose-6-phosphate 1-dehydrogenase|nr:glucose-6-phosphate dehydrogenase [Candidatus Paceibacterota bacterium]
MAEQTKQNNPAASSTVPTVLVVLGATGDLMTKKIAPALFALHEAKKLPPYFELVGVSRRHWHDDELRKHVREILAVKAPDASKRSVESFLSLMRYHKIEFNMLEDYKALKDTLSEMDNSLGMCANKLFYLSVPPQFYETILENIHKAHLADACGDPGEGWTRIIVEKPFGSDEKSAKALDAKLSKLFKEEQIYRIDHYPAKEMLQNLLVFRFANDLFERDWSNETVESIHLRLFEKIGVEDRGAFYDHVGALRDMGQNHHLQMLALVTMERPARYDAPSIRSARAALFEQLQIPTLKEAATRSFRAQYEGFRTIKGVDPHSSTETYFRVKGFLESARWEGVPIIMESGKRLGESLKEIEIVLRHETPCLCPPGRHVKNRIVIHIEPKEGISIAFHSKKPGHELAIEEKFLNFDFRGGAGGGKGGSHTQYTEEYEKLLLDCIAGDQTLFVSSEEIAAMWRFVDPFVAAWQKNLVPLRHYAPDSRAIVAEADVASVAAAKDGVNALPREIGVFGLGKMGANVARQLKEKGWRVVAANRSPGPVEEMEKEGFETAHSQEELAQKLSAAGSRGARNSPPRVVWLMITSGAGIDEFIFGADGKSGIAALLRKGDIVIDGGNSFFEDTMRRAKLLAKRGIHFMDVGFSGGPAGARHGGSLMIGGDRKTYAYLEPLFADLSVPLGYAHFGDAGAGHFVKMVHNGIEYGMMQSIAEGFALMKKSPFKLDLARVARVYQHGSVIESRLVGWMEEAFRVYGEDLGKVSGAVAATGEGEWTVKTGRKWGMKLPAIEDSFKFRVASKKKPSYMGRILSALRNRFGGHKV